MPPHLNHMGDDVSRGLLTFAVKKKLGLRGLWWLKVHLSNLFGNDKVPLVERHAFIEQNLDKVVETAQAPIDVNLGLI